MKSRAAFAQSAVGFAILFALLALAPPARAQATIAVNSTAQEVTLANPGGVVNGNCTVGEAILAANTNAAVDACVAGQSSGTDTIMVPAGTYTFTAVADSFSSAPYGLPRVLSAITFQGAGAATTIMERSSAMGTPSFYFMLLNSPTVFRGMSVRAFGGSSGPNGTNFMILGNGPLTLENMVLENSTVDSDLGAGAGTPNCATVTINNSLFRNNTNIRPGAPGTVVGGGPSFVGTGACGTVTITNSTFANNTNQAKGGAVAFGAGVLTISNSVLTSNNALEDGGAIALLPSNNNTGTVTIDRCQFVGNSTTNGNASGGGAILAGPGMTVDITGSTFLNNTSAREGGAILKFTSRPMTISNSTFTGNVAVTEGGAIGISVFQTNTPQLFDNVTLVGNTSINRASGGVMIHGTMTRMRNSIVAGNFPQNFSSSFGGGPGFHEFFSDGHNLLGETNGTFYNPGTGDQVGTGANPLNPLVRGVADNGSTVMAGANIAGVTSPVAIQTMGLLTGSPALGMGNPGVPGSGSPACEATDQRGIVRPQPLGGVCDVGAFEDLTGAGVAASFDLSVTKTDSADPVTVNNNLTYTITISNAGPDPAPAVVLTDALPAGVTFVSATPSNAPTGTCVQAAGTVTCNLGTLAANGTLTVSIVVTVTGAATSPISNTSSVTATGNEANAADNSATEVTVVMGLTVNLSVTKTDTPDPINLGQGNVTYTVTVTSLSGNASNVVLTDTLPGTANFVSATPSQGVCPAPVGGVLTCNLGAISNGANATVTVVVTPTAIGTLTNTASVTAAETDSNPANNSATSTTTVNALADLDANKTDAADPVLAGSNITYTLNVQNLGSSPATNVVLVDTLPASVTFVSVNGPCAHNAGIVTCNFGGLAAGAFTPNVTLVVTSTAASVPSVLNRSVATANESDPNPGNNNGDETTTVNPVADLSVTKTDAPDPVTVGSNITYTITIANAGPSAATGVMATDAVPANVTFVSATGSQGTCTLAAGTITCNVGTINSGASVTATVVVTATATGTVSNTISVSSAVADPNNANNSATASTTVNAATNASDFTITAAPALQTVSPGQTATFVVTLTPIGGSFNSAITLSCFLDPPLGPCALNPTSVTPGATPGTSTLTVMVPSGSALPALPRFTPPAAPWVLLCVACAAMLAWLRMRAATPNLRRRYAASLALIVALIALGTTQSACTTAGNGLKGAYTVTVTATSGSLSHATNVTVNVQ